MTDLRFGWDDRKASANVAKHQVSFEEARSVFLDEDALLIPDVAHSQEEERFMLRCEPPTPYVGSGSLLPASGRSYPHHLGTTSESVRARAVRDKEESMRNNYDFSKGIRNPYAKKLKRQLTIRLDNETIAYFQGLSDELAIPYQTLINMYLRECAETQKRPQWLSPRARLAKQANKRRQPTTRAARGG